MYIYIYVYTYNIYIFLFTYLPIVYTSVSFFSVLLASSVLEIKKKDHILKALKLIFYVLRNLCAIPTTVIKNLYLLICVAALRKVLRLVYSSLTM